jgi:hypothetical protein
VRVGINQNEDCEAIATGRSGGASYYLHCGTIGGSGAGSGASGVQGHIIVGGAEERALRSKINSGKRLFAKKPEFPEALSDQITSKTKQSVPRK